MYSRMEILHYHKIQMMSEWNRGLIASRVIPKVDLTGGTSALYP